MERGHVGVDIPPPPKKDGRWESGVNAQVTPGVPRLPGPCQPHLSSREMRMSVMRGGSSGSTQPSTLSQGWRTTVDAAHCSSPAFLFRRMTLLDSAAPTKPSRDCGSCLNRISSGMRPSGPRWMVCSSVCLLQLQMYTASP